MKVCTEPGCNRPGTTAGPCIQCKFKDGVRVEGLVRFKNDREMGLTQAARYRETIDSAKRDGTAERIARVPGGRTASERMVNGSWEKV